MAPDLRKQLAAEGLMLPLPEPEAFAFEPALFEPSSAPGPAPRRRTRRRRRTTDAAVELVIYGVADKIGRSADERLIRVVIDALKAAR